MGKRKRQRTQEDEAYARIDNHVERDGYHAMAGSHAVSDTVPYGIPSCTGQPAMPRGIPTVRPGILPRATGSDWVRTQLAAAGSGSVAHRKLKGVRFSTRTSEWSTEHTCTRTHATRSVTHATCNVTHATHNVKHATAKAQHAACNVTHARCSVSRAANTASCPRGPTQRTVTDASNEGRPGRQWAGFPSSRGTLAYSQGALVYRACDRTARGAGGATVP